MWQGVLIILHGLIPMGPALSIDDEALLMLNLKVFDASTPPRDPLPALTIPQNSFTYD